MNTDWRVLHKQVMVQFLLYLNKCSDKYVLKGGTALMLCYNLTRFSEDIDLDVTTADTKIKDIVLTFCRVHNIEYRIAKDTAIVKRFMLHYGGAKPLKIEISYRSKALMSDTARVNGIMVYNINRLAELKAQAYLGRDKLRDLFDVTFICLGYFKLLPVATQRLIRDVVVNKGIEQVDYLTTTQHDDLIDVDILEKQFLTMWEMLGL